MINSFLFKSCIPLLVTILLILTAACGEGRNTSLLAATATSNTGITVASVGDLCNPPYSSPEASVDLSDLDNKFLVVSNGDIDAVFQNALDPVQAASSLQDATVVVCEEISTYELETCTYTQDATLTVIGRYITLYLINVATEQTLATNIVYGEDVGCPPTYEFGSVNQATITADVLPEEFISGLNEAITGEPDPAKVEQGKVRYIALQCNACHGENGEGTERGSSLTTFAMSQPEFNMFLRSGGTIGASHIFSTNLVSDRGIRNLYKYLQSLSTG
jgi:hypothetical protein